MLPPLSNGHEPLLPTALDAAAAGSVYSYRYVPDCTYRNRKNIPNQRREASVPPRLVRRRLEGDP